MNWTLLVIIGGILHLGLILAGALVPGTLNWKESLGKLDRLSRQLIWVHGGYIVLIILSFALLSLIFPGELLAGTPLARAACLFIGVFWSIRLLIQFFVFDAGPYLKNGLLKAGYYCLTLVFLYHAVVYSWIALRPPG